MRAALTAVALTLGFLPLMGGVAHAADTSFSINDVIVSETAATATFTITRSGNTTDAATVTYQTFDGTATAGSDFTAVGPTVLSFAADDTTETVTVPIVNDADDEARIERFQVRLTAPSAGDFIADGIGSAELVDDEGAVILSIDDAVVTEGDAGTVNMEFTVIRSGPTTAAASATFTTANGTATAGTDYQATTGIVTVAAGAITATAAVPVIGDTVAEPNETFTVALSNPTGATVLPAAANGTIVDDETTARLSIDDVEVTEGDSGITNAEFTVTRSGVTTGAVSATFTTSNGTATAGEDYTATTGTVNFADGETTQTVTVPVRGDTTPEPAETFIVTLSAPTTGAVVIEDAEGVATIIDGDESSNLSIDDVSVIEGDSGTTNAVFTVTQTGGTTPSGATYTITPGTATAGVDYDNDPSTGTIAFTGAADEESQTITVPVIGDTLEEPDETFTVTLSLATGSGVLDDATGTGTIVDDDAPAVQPAGQQGYSLVASDGGIFNFGNSKFFGSTGSIRLNQPVVGMDHTPTTQGYWLVAADGGIFSFGDAKFFGSTGAIKLNKPIVGMRSTPTGNGYWLVASDGGIFSFGDAKFFGSTGAIRLNQPIVGMERTPTGNGYWLVASDGGIFSFGDAEFFGSTGAIRLNLPVVGMARTNSGDGYFLVASDGGIFSFGDAVFRGSTGAIRLNSPVTGMMVTATGTGYWLCARDGGVFAFGNAQFLGSMGATRLNQPVVGCDAPLSQNQFG